MKMSEIRNHFKKWIYWFLLGVISHIMGAADALVMGIIAIVTGIKKATSVFFMALMFVSIISGVLLIIKRLKRKDTIPFIPFIFISYVGVMICG